MAQAVSFLGVSILGAGLYLTKLVLDSRRLGPLPPGPIGWPVVGNLFQISSEKNWEDFTALGKKYGTRFSSSYQSPYRIHYLRGYFVHKHPRDTLRRFELPQGHHGGARKTEHQMFG